MTYSRMGDATLPSAMQRFTSEFGKGSGGSTALLSSGKTNGLLCQQGFERVCSEEADVIVFVSMTASFGAACTTLGCYMVKPHG